MRGSIDRGVVEEAGSHVAFSTRVCACILALGGLACGSDDRGSSADRNQPEGGSAGQRAFGSGGDDPAGGADADPDSASDAGATAVSDAGGGGTNAEGGSGTNAEGGSESSGTGSGGKDAPAPVDDVEAPTAHVVFPTRVSYTDGATLTVRGTAADNDRVASVTVNGVRATSANRFASWQAIVPISPLDNELVVSATDRAGNASAAADRVHVSNRGQAVARVLAVALDAPHDRLVLLQEEQVLAWDLLSGTTTVLSGPQREEFAPLDHPSNLVLDEQGERAIVLDTVRPMLLAVNAASTGPEVKKTQR